MEFVLKIIVVFLLVLLNGFFVASEFALVAVRKTRIAELARRGHKTAKLVSEAHRDLDSVISATQLGITLASLALGWVGEPALAHFFEPFFHFLPEHIAFISAHSIAVFVAFFIITVLHVVVGEVAPKTIALQKPESVALFIVVPLILFTKVFKPFIWFLNEAGYFVLRLLRFEPATDLQKAHSEEEIKMILIQSVEGGAIEPSEAKMASRVFRLADIPINQIMVPRTDVVGFPVTSTLQIVLDEIDKKTHSRFPVFEQTVDDIIGFIHVKDIYRALKDLDKDVRLIHANLIRPILTVPEDKKADDVLFAMQRRRIHIAVVNDEHGGTAGIVTLEDILESVVGEIEDEFETPVQSIKKHKDGSFLVSGLTPLQDLNSKLKLHIQTPGYATVGPFVHGLLGSEPKKGDVVQIGTVVIEVFELSEKRIKTLKISKRKKESL